MRLDQLLKIVLTSVDYGCLLGFAGRVDTKAYSVYDDQIYGLFEALMALHFIAIDFHEVYDAEDIPDRESLALEGLELGVFRLAEGSQKVDHVEDRQGVAVSKLSVLAQLAYDQEQIDCHGHLKVAELAAAR